MIFVCNSYKIHWPGLYFIWELSEPFRVSLPSSWPEQTWPGTDYRRKNSLQNLPWPDPSIGELQSCREAGHASPNHHHIHGVVHEETEWEVVCSSCVWCGDMWRSHNTQHLSPVRTFQIVKLLISKVVFGLGFGLWLSPLKCSLMFDYKSSSELLRSVKA